MKRIGVKDKAEIKKHPFFKNLDWEKVRGKEYKPPIDRVEMTEKMLKKDETLRFQDYDYEDVNYNENRVPDFSFAMSFKDKI